MWAFGRANGIGEGPSAHPAIPEGPSLPVTRRLPPRALNCPSSGILAPFVIRLTGLLVLWFWHYLLPTSCRSTLPTTSTSTLHSGGLFFTLEHPSRTGRELVSSALGEGPPEESLSHLTIHAPAKETKHLPTSTGQSRASSTFSPFPSPPLCFTSLPFHCIRLWRFVPEAKHSSSHLAVLNWPAITAPANTFPHQAHLKP